MDLAKIFQRVKNVLLTPNSEWPAIAAESVTTGAIYTGYVLIVAAVPALFMFLSLARWTMSGALSGALVSYGMSLLSVFLISLLVNALAPSFGAQKNDVQALKTVAYSYTAAWVAGIAVIVPFLGMLVALAGGVYSIYLLYLGLQHCMKAPRDKAAGYTAVVVIIAIVISWIASAVAWRMPGMGMMGPGAVFGSRSRPDAAEVRVDEAVRKMAEASRAGDRAKQVEAAGGVLGAVLGGAGGNVETLSTERIKALVPDTLLGLPRTSLAAERNGAMGLMVSEADAEYGDENRTLRLEIKDLGGVAGLMALANWAEVESESQSESGYEKTYRDAGRMVNEKWDRSDGSGEYSLIVAQRFLVHASGSAESIEQLKQAVASVDLAALETLSAQGK
jgi:hypothetical protein